jgi:hypothetical protein
MFEPNELIRRDFESLTDLEAQLLDTIRDALTGISGHLNTCNDYSSIRQIDPLNEAHAVAPITSFVCEKLRLVCD